MDPNDLPSVDEPPPPPYSEQSALPGGRWELACSIDEQGRSLQLDAAGTPTWMYHPSGKGYERDGFGVTFPSTSEINVKTATRTWACDEKTPAGQLLTTKRETVSLRHVGQYLFVFEKTVVVKDLSRPAPEPREDLEGCLEIKAQSGDIWLIAGTDIYQVEGSMNDVVVRSPNYLRLWDTARGKIRWEKWDPIGFGGPSRILGFTEKYIIEGVGLWHLRERKTGHNHGNFDIPHYTAFQTQKPPFGPIMSTSSVFLYKPGLKVLFFFRIHEKQNIVYFRMWEATEPIHGSLVLRGSLDDLELTLIGQMPDWTKYEQKEVICKNDFIKRRLL